MRADPAKELATFTEGVVTAVDPEGYPVSVRQSRLRYHISTGEMHVTWPDGVAVAEGPANLLCHSHDEKLWSLRALQIKGRLERRDDGWVFVGSAFTPPPGVVVMFWRAARSNRAAGHRYLKKRGLRPPQVNWAAIKEIHRRALLGQQHQR